MDVEDAPLRSQESLEKDFGDALRSRALLIQRLSDLVCWPATRIPVNERELAGDVLVGLLRQAPVELRQNCAQHLAIIQDAPKMLLRWLARDELQVAQVLLEHSNALDDGDLLATIRACPKPHWLAIARRKMLGELVGETLIKTGDPEVVEAVLRNTGARLTSTALDLVVMQSRKEPRLCAALLPRSEMRPSQALTLFWWSDAPTRAAIIKRFAVERGVLINEMADLFSMAAKEGWQDPETRKALHLIERRQRNRLAAEKSPYNSLEGAFEAAQHGVDRALALEIAHLAGIRPQTCANILADPGGEAIAILCKATGVKREGLLTLWRNLRRPLHGLDEPNSPFGRVLLMFDTTATAKAQTVLRYWNWSLGSETVNTHASEIDPLDESLEFNPQRRSQALVFGRRAG
jgi:uncharacterized protein (DUF2336 family)